MLANIPIHIPQGPTAGAEPVLDMIALKCLAKHPADRFSSAETFANELGRWLRSEPSVIFPVSRVRRTALWTRRHPMAALMASAVSIASVLGVWGHQARMRSELYFERVALVERELAATNFRRAEELLEACPRSLRGWEWSCLRPLVDRDAPVLQTGVPSLGAAISRDGRLAAAAGLDGRVRCWDTASRVLLWERACFAGPARGVAFDPAGRRLAVAGGNYDVPGDAAIRVLDAASGRELLALAGQPFNPWRVIFSPDGHRLAFSGGGKSPGKRGGLRLCDAATGAGLATLGDVRSRVFGIAFSPDGYRLASAGDDGHARIWELASGRQIVETSGEPGANFCMAFSPNGRWLATGGGRLNYGDSGNVTIWDAATGRMAFPLSGHTDEVWGVAFNPDGSRLASASKDHTVKIWDLQARREALTLHGHADNLWAASWSDGGILLTAGEDGQVRLWGVPGPPDPVVEPPPVRLTGHADRVWCVAYSPDGTRLASGSEDRTIRIWNLATNREERVLDGHTAGVRGVAWSPDGRQLASASYDNTVRLWDPRSGATLAVLSDEDGGWNHAIAFDPRGGRLATASNYGLTLWETGPPPRHRTIQGHRWVIGGLAYLPTGEGLLTGSWDRTVVFRQPDTGAIVRTMRGHTGRICSVDVSRDGATAVTASNDGTIGVWNTATGLVRLRLRGHAMGVLDAVISQDGRWVASASRDQTVRLWDAITGTELRRWRGHAGSLRAVAFSPDGRQFAVASGAEHLGEIALRPVPRP